MSTLGQRATRTIHRASVDPVADKDASRPLWSVMIPTFNCAQFLRETLRSVLEQDPGPESMQIEVVDDHSMEDDPEAVVRELAPGRVRFFRQPQNVGHVGNFNTCLARSRGHLIHVLHGDDMVMRGFYEVMERPFREHSEIGAAWCRQIIVDEGGRWVHVSRLEESASGVIPDWLERIASGQRLQTPAMVVRREVYETIGGFDSRVGYGGEDWEMWVRIGAAYPVWHEVRPLAIYRQHKLSLTGRTERTGGFARDLRRVIEINTHVLPDLLRNELTKEARINNAMGFLRRAKRLADVGQIYAPAAHIREALGFEGGARVVVAAFATTGWCLLKIIQIAGRRIVP